ncbi:MAG: flagellar assembly protein FliW [Candidatus Eremiobacteraeota bacterium]|nr:flagellar assembly protein FliW [Candidatus Eremiobacteraeota bacterium]
MTLEFPRFGSFTFSQTEVFEFPWGLPGFAHLHRFLALSLPEQQNFIWLQSLDDLNFAIPTADPWSIFPDYDPKLPMYATSALALQSPDDFTILGVVVVSKGAEEMTMNLLAPVVVNLKTRRGRQIMLENSSYPVRQPIPRKSDLESAEQPSVEAAASP